MTIMGGTISDKHCKGLSMMSIHRDMDKVYHNKSKKRKKTNNVHTKIKKRKKLSLLELILQSFEGGDNCLRI